MIHACDNCRGLSSVFGGAARTEPELDLVSLGAFPAMVSGGGTAVAGGFGIIAGYGAPDMRVFAGTRFAPKLFDDEEPAPAPLILDTDGGDGDPVTYTFQIDADRSYGSPLLQTTSGVSADAGGIAGELVSVGRAAHPYDARRHGARGG